jgi:uncharacterized paraquat-inducible protein A
MQEERRERRGSQNLVRQLNPNFTRPVWHDQQMTCENCRYANQDIDTFPCAKCHTRH